MNPLIGGIVLDLALGDPSRWPHPVRWIGRGVGAGERFIRARRLSPRSQQLAGIGLALLVVGGTWTAASLALMALAALWAPLAWLAGAIMAWSCLSLKDLSDHLKPVIKALFDKKIEDAQRGMSRVVGRETDGLDQTGLCRAGLETMAESLGDGVVAPLFYFILGGPALGLAYKAVNTLDSMIGYPYPPYTHLGRWPAKLDDAVNWVPARLAFGLLVAAAAVKGLRPGRAWRIGLAEHHHSTSPNAGWPEAAMAGALDVSLLGPAVYFGQRRDKPYLNPDGRPPEPADLKAGLGLIWAAGLLAYALAAVLVLI